MASAPGGGNLMLTVSTRGHKIPTNPLISIVPRMADALLAAGSTASRDPLSPPSQSASRSSVGLSPGSVLVGTSGSRDRTHQPKPHHAKPSRHVQTAHSTVVPAAFRGLRPVRGQCQRGAGSQLPAQPKRLRNAPRHEVPRIPSHLHAGVALGTPRHSRTPSLMAGTRHSHASPS